MLFILGRRTGLRCHGASLIYFAWAVRRWPPRGADLPPGTPRFTKGSDTSLEIEWYLPQWYGGSLPVAV